MMPWGGVGRRLAAGGLGLTLAMLVAGCGVRDLAARAGTPSARDPNAPIVFATSAPTVGAAAGTVVATRTPMEALATATVGAGPPGAASPEVSATATALPGEMVAVANTEGQGVWLR